MAEEIIMASTVGNRIRERRKALGLSAEELGGRIGKDRATIYRYENGDIEKLPASSIWGLAKALHSTPDYLMGWVDDPEDYEAIANDEGWSIPSDFMPNADSYDRVRAYYKFKKAEEEDQAADFHKEAEADRRLLNAYHAADPKTQKAICIMLGIEE